MTNLSLTFDFDLSLLMKTVSPILKEGLGDGPAPLLNNFAEDRQLFFFKHSEHLKVAGHQFELCHLRIGL